MTDEDKQEIEKIVEKFKEAGAKLSEIETEEDKTAPFSQSQRISRASFVRKLRLSLADYRAKRTMYCY